MWWRESNTRDARVNEQLHGPVVFVEEAPCQVQEKVCRLSLVSIISSVMLFLSAE
jgi:hypothetical protein